MEERTTELGTANERLRHEITKRERSEERLRKNEQRLRAMSDLLVKIVENEKVDLENAFEEITETAANTLEVEGNSIWLMNQDRSASQCYGFFQRSTGEHSKGQEFEHHPDFYKLFEESRTIALSDVHKAPQFKEFYEHCSSELNVTSAIKAPIRISGETRGVLSVDHVGAVREWTVEEQDFVRYLADIASITIESSERLHAQRILEHRTAFDQLINQITTEFISLSPFEYDIAINHALQRAGEFTGVDRSYVFLFNGDKSKMSITHEWCAEGIEPRIDKLGNMDTALSPWLMDRLNRFENIHVPFVGDLPDEAKPEKELLQAQNIESILIVPLEYHSSLYGFIGLHSVRAVKYFFGGSISLLETVGRTIVRGLEHKRVHEELREANEDLERKVEERTRELRQKHAQLVQSEKMAALGNLVAGVAHEIYNPIGTIKSNCDIFTRYIGKIKSLTKGAAEDPELSKFLTDIEGLSEVSQIATDRIMKIVDSLRTFVHLDKAEIGTVDIHDGIESTLTLVHHETKGRIEVHKDYGDVPEIPCYPDQLNQVFMNILVNASQAIGEKGHIYIKTRTRDSKAIIEIKDTGKGISKEDLGQIFHPGFTTKTKGAGTGLGLSIVHQIIEDHNGNIEVESEIGRGTMFRIVLPIERSFDLSYHDSSTLTT